MRALINILPERVAVEGVSVLAKASTTASGTIVAVDNVDQTVRTLVEMTAQWVDLVWRRYGVEKSALPSSVHWSTGTSPKRNPVEVLQEQEKPKNREQAFFLFDRFSLLTELGCEKSQKWDCASNETRS